MAWNRGKNKYGAHKANFRGVQFDSNVELQRYLYLKDMLRRGEITDLRRQVEFEIIPQVTKSVPVQLKTKIRYDKRVVEQAAHYTADFIYKENGVFVMEDIKSEATQDVRDFPLRRKLMVAKIYAHNAKGRSQWMFREAVLTKEKKLKITDR